LPRPAGGRHAARRHTGSRPGRRQRVARRRGGCRRSRPCDRACSDGSRAGRAARRRRARVGTGVGADTRGVRGERARARGARVKRLVFVTQQADPEHPVLGATVAQIAALAQRVDEVLVLANGDVVGGLPPNVRVQSFRAPTKAARTVRYLRALVPARAQRPVAGLAHMSPVYAVLAAPLGRPLGVPVLLWFTHWRDSRLLRLAERVSTRVLTVAPESFPFPSPKLVATGHAIDVLSMEAVARE